VIAELKQHGRVDHPYLGVVGHPISANIAKLFNLAADHGLLVERVIPGSGAEKAGLRGGTNQAVVEGESYQLGGDLIVRADGIELTSTERLREIVAERKPGDTLEIEYYRGSEPMTADVRLGRQPPTPQE
jgi:serine protease Do